jgi:hypothetical protein
VNAEMNIVCRDWFIPAGVGVAGAGTVVGDVNSAEYRA